MHIITLILKIKKIFKIIFNFPFYSFKYFIKKVKLALDYPH